MILKLLLFSSLDFATFVLGAFVFLSAGLLLIDSWSLHKSKKTFLARGIGFLLMALVYTTYASSIDAPEVILGVQILKILALTIIFLSLIKEPVLEKPKNNKGALAIPLALPIINSSLVPVSAALMLMISLIYLRKSTEGYDKQLKPMFFSFFFLALSEFIKTSFFWSDTTIVFWSKALAVHSWFWNAHIALQCLSLIILGIWVWGYIRFRVQIELFVTMLASIFVVFLTTTFFFSYLLLNNLENSTLNSLKTDANVFQYALDRLQLESLSHARSLAVDSGFKDALESGDKDKLYNITSDALISLSLTSLTVTSASGEVIIRAEDKENVGDNMSKELLVENALSGQQLSTFLVDDGPINPEISVKSSVPIKNDNGEILGTVLTGFAIDNAFVDGVKEVTGLDATVFANNRRAATTIIGPDGKSRFTGTIESNEDITTSVLKESKIFTGSSEVLNTPYYTVYTPLKAYGDKVVGMLFIGKPQIELLDTAQKSINLTFLGSVVMMLVSLIPAFFVSRFIRRNLEA